MEVNKCIGFGALKLRCTQYGFCGLGGLQECNDNWFLKSGGACNILQSGSKNNFGVAQGLQVVGPDHYPIRGPLAYTTRWGCLSVQHDILLGDFFWL